MRARLRRLLKLAIAMIAVSVLGVSLAATVALKSEWGRTVTTNRLRAMLAAELAPGTDVALHGLVLTPIGTARLDSLVLRDSTGASVAALRGLAVAFNLRAALDRELHLTSVIIDRLDLDLVQDAAGRWNVASLAKQSTAASTGDSSAALPWRVRIDTLSWRDGSISVTRPDSLPSLPPRRDVATCVGLDLGPTVLSTKGPAGTVALAEARASVDVPIAAGAAAMRPLALRVESGSVALAEGSAKLSLPQLRIGRSRSALSGDVDWSDATRDPRLALDLRATELHLGDVAWFDPYIPREGRATARLRVTNGPRDGEFRADVQRFVVEATDSRLEGRLVAEIGDTLRVRNLDVVAAPLDFRLIRELFGEQSPPQPWDGSISGQVRGAGGPLRAFKLDESTIALTDRRVGGAVSRFTISGELNLESAQTAFQPLFVRIDSMDIRSAGAVTDIADSLSGYLSGSLTLTGPLDNFRFSELNLLHTDGNHPRTHLRGEGRIAEDTASTWLEAALTFDTLALAPYGRAVAGEPLRGKLEGSLNASARGDSLALELSLIGEGAALQFRGATSMDTARLVAKGRLTVEDLDAARFLPSRTLPAHRLSGAMQLGIDGGWDAPSGPLVFSFDTTSRLLDLPVRIATGSLALEPGGVRVDSVLLEMDAGRVSARGRLARDPTLRDTLRFVAKLDSAKTLAPLLGDSLSMAWADSIGGTLRITGIAVGSLDTMDVRATLDGDSLRLASFGIATMTGELLLDGVPSATRGLATFDLVDARAGEAVIHRLSAEATVREAKWVDASFRLIAQDTLFAQGRADIHYMGDSLELRLDSLTATTREADWRLAAPARAFRGPDRLEVDSLLLLSRDGARFALWAQVDSSGPLSVVAKAHRVPLAHARFTGYMPPRVDGFISLDANLQGTLANPTLQLSLALDSTQVDGRPAPSLSSTARYADSKADITVNGRMLERDAFSLTAELPVDLSLEARSLDERLLERELYVRLVANGTQLAGFEALMPGVRELSGGLEADVQVTGTWRELEPRGILLVRDAAFIVPALGTGFRDMLMDVSLAPDSILIQRARLADERAVNDTAALEGSIVRAGSTWRTDIRTVARNLRVIDDPRVAEADVSWALNLRGPLDSLVLRGDVTVPQANVFIGRQRRRALALAEDAEDTEVASQYAPRLEGVRLRLGNEVRLRSPEANVQLTGEVAAAGTLDEPDVRGEIFAARGTFRLDLGLLQRTFQVDSGLVRLNGPLSIPPTLDIHTSYTVRQADREDVKIGARLTGAVDSPRLVLSSGDLGTTASETEIISYLLFGAPSFVLDGQSASAVRLATAALVPSLGGAAERALGARLPFLSELQVVTVAGDTPRDFTLNSFEGLLNSFALTAGTQVGTDSYLRLSGGVCRGENRAAQSLPAWFGITGEYRPRERLSAELSLTPGSAPCNRIGTFSQIYQLGLDLYKDWRW